MKQLAEEASGALLEGRQDLKRQRETDEQADAADDHIVEEMTQSSKGESIAEKKVPINTHFFSFFQVYVQRH